MADDLALGLSDEGGEHDSFGAQPVNEIGLVWPVECLLVDQADRGVVFGSFASDEHGFHLLWQLCHIPAAAENADESYAGGVRG